MIATAERWRIVAIVEAVLLTLVIGAIIFIGTTTQYTPVIYGVNSTLVQTTANGWSSSTQAGDPGIPVTGALADTPATPSPTAVTAAVGQWFNLARSVDPDNAINYSHTQFLYTMTGGAATGVLADSYKNGNDPFTLSGKETVAVSVDSILPQGSNNYLVDWTETASDLHGVVTGTQKWEAQITVATSPPNDLGTIMHNPLGFYITSLSWTKKS
jgi:type IV secretion system protein VirB5